MSPVEWDALEWWEKRLLLDGLQLDGVLGSSNAQSPGGPVPAGPQKGNGTVAAMTRRSAAVDLSKLPQQLAAIQGSVLDGL